jgi:hypothetical protein
MRKELALLAIVLLVVLYLLYSNKQSVNSPVPTSTPVRTPIRTQSPVAPIGELPTQSPNLPTPPSVEPSTPSPIQTTQPSLPSLKSVEPFIIDYLNTDGFGHPCVYIDKNDLSNLTGWSKVTINQSDLSVSLQNVLRVIGTNPQYIGFEYVPSEQIQDGTTSTKLNVYYGSTIPTPPYFMKQVVTKCNIVVNGIKIYTNIESNANGIYLYKLTY